MQHTIQITLLRQIAKHENFISVSDEQTVQHKDVACKKISTTHPLHEVKFVHSSLPEALSWIGKSESNIGLSQFYNFNVIPQRNKNKCKLLKTK
jgi:hypothetical protein